MQVKVIELSVNNRGFCDKEKEDYEDLNAVKQDYPSAYGLAKIDGDVEINFHICEANCLTRDTIDPENSIFRVFLDDGETIDLTNFTKFLPENYEGDQENWRDEVEEMLSSDPEVAAIKDKLKIESLNSYNKFKKYFRELS